MATILINTATRTAITITGERNIRFASVSRRLRFRADRVSDSLSDYPGVQIVGEYDEASPELAGLWFESYK